MANICDFSMVIRGKEADCENFLKALSRGSKEWIGDGAEIFDISTDKIEDEKVRMAFLGDCRWSVESALIDFVEFVEEKPDVWSNVTEENRPTTYFTLDEACSKYGVDCEVYSQEGGCGFQEHILIKDGEIYENDSVDWEEGTLLDWYNTKEEAEEDLKLTITEEEWKNGKLDNVGGYGKWEFEI